MIVILMCKLMDIAFDMNFLDAKECWVKLCACILDWGRGWDGDFLSRVVTVVTSPSLSTLLQIKNNVL